MGYFGTVYRAIRTVCAGLRVTMPYFGARTVVVQYPEVAPVSKDRFRGFHTFEIERCIGCEACARSCPVECISVGRSGARKYDKKEGVATGGAITTYKIDYNMCLFCGLCTEVCPTQCLTMGRIHDGSCYDRGDLVVDFVELSRRGRRTIEPIWLKKPGKREWAGEIDRVWSDKLDERVRELMVGASDPEYCKALAEKVSGGDGKGKAKSKRGEGEG